MLGNVEFEFDFFGDFGGRGRNLRFFLEELRAKLIGWVSYFRKSEVRGVFKQLDSWIRRKLRAILWRQWKRNWTRAKNLMRLGLSEARARPMVAALGSTPDHHVGYPKIEWRASHMNQAITTKYLTDMGLVSLHHKLLQFQR